MHSLLDELPFGSGLRPKLLDVEHVHQVDDTPRHLLGQCGPPRGGRYRDRTGTQITGDFDLTLEVIDGILPALLTTVAPSLHEIYERSTDGIAPSCVGREGKTGFRKLRQET